MTNRELFHEIMFYGKVDRMPLVHWAAWDETMERWYDEGLEKGTDIHKFLGTKPHWTSVGCNLNLHPAFPKEILEETPEYTVIREGDGVIQKEWKTKSSIPHFIDCTFKNATQWPEFKKRLQPDLERLPKDLDATIDKVISTGLPIAVDSASLMGWFRNWMGVEGLSYLMCEDPDCFSDMVMTVADLTCWSLDIILSRMKEKGVMADFAFGWEDICGRGGPLVSPSIFTACVAPGYRKIRNTLESYGCHLLCVDSDGVVEQLLPCWLDAGVNLQFPIEVGSWKADGMALRQKFGKDLRIVGHFDKMTLELSREAVQAEIKRLLPLMKDGGYMLMPDHLITPGTSLDMYRWYLDEIRNLRF